MFTIKKAAYLSLIIGAVAAATTGSATAATATTSMTALEHYQLANALVKAGKAEQAIPEYKTAFLLSPRSQVGAFSLQALSAFGQLQQTAAAVGAESPKTNEIARQSQEMKALAKRQADNSIRDTKRGAQNQINNIEAERTTAVNNVLANPSIQSTVVPVFNPFRRNRFGFGVVNTVDPVATQARIDQVNNVAALQRDRVQAQAADKAERLKEAQEERSRLIDESADNLQSQTVGKGVKLNAGRSNLFVRTYN